MGPSGCGPGELARNLKLEPNKEWGEPRGLLAKTFRELGGLVSKSLGVRSWHNRNREEP